MIGDGDGGVADGSESSPEHFSPSAGDGSPGSEHSESPAADVGNPAGESPAADVGADAPSPSSLAGSAHGEGGQCKICSFEML